ncbi:MAG: phosphotransferase [Deltaproteobacteria bacterium]
MLESMIEDLLKPEALPDPTRRVKLVQTHISLVFVADEFVYKVKKPVNFGFLDFTTFEKRAFYCRQELDLNRRLAKDVYLDVLPVRFDGKRHSMRSGRGKIVEHAVKMKRISEKRLMKSLYERRALTDNHLERLARTLAEFHAHALRNPAIDAFGEPDRFRINTDENFDQIRKYIGVSIGKKQFAALEDWTDRFYRASRELFYRRISQGKIRDCHGDLHMEHVCFSRNLSIIDCIEFNDRFRYSDTVADIAFLLMDLEYHGGKKHSAALWEHYRKFAGEEAVEPLLDFYKVYRAVVRGKVNSFQVDDPRIASVDKERAVARAKKYFALACSYLKET